MKTPQDRLLPSCGVEKSGVNHLFTSATHGQATESQQAQRCCGGLGNGRVDKVELRAVVSPLKLIQGVRGEEG